MQKPGVPIVVGGHTELAARRAARYGDGFFPGVADDEKLTWLLGVMRDECKKIGRNPAEIEITSGRAVPDVDNVKHLRDLGVARFMVPPPAFDPDGITQGLEKLGALIAKVS
jgi:alkanesulfonate monooxygenase SsuD/methylene tetrahydromethanopterin reductase-like flavin-dependent oxidoreductase (luciferase family)